jgi:PHD/YefM family antitoxin component YafN of YafNO toxin-antitoxin module
MTTIASTDFKKHYGEFFDAALKEPVIIQKHHRNSLVMMAYDLFQKLQARVAELEDYKLVHEMAEIKKNGKFVKGQEAIDMLTSMIKK